MSQGNASAMIGLANTNKQPMIGGYKQGVQPKWGANGNYIGLNGETKYSYNALGEAAGFLAPSTIGVAGDKNAQWVTSTAGLAAGTVKVSVAAGDATADNAAGTWSVYGVPAAGVPANSWFWVFSD